MRIVAGKYRGRRVAVPKGNVTRPTADRVREALFSALGDVEGLDVLDLFAGSGALGIEALSRGAASATFIEQDARVCGTIKDNLQSLEIVEASVLRQDALTYLRNRSSDKQFNLVFVDPPYRMAEGLSEQLSDTLPGVLKGSARVICESDRRKPLDLNLNLQWERRYGDTVIKIYEPS